VSANRDTGVDVAYDGPPGAWVEARLTTTGAYGIVLEMDVADSVGPGERPCGEPATVCRPGPGPDIIVAQEAPGTRVQLITVWPGDTFKLTGFCRPSFPDEPPERCGGKLTVWAVDETGQRVGDLTIARS
jgi:hypothetical protein